MTDNKQVMQQALDALLGYKPYSLTHAKEQGSAIIALREAIAQPEQTATWQPTQAAITALKRFEETCSDGEGYDVPKETMYVLSSIGLIYKSRRAAYCITDFGQHILATAIAQPEHTVDTGPWQVNVWPGKNEVVIQSDYFKHDTALIINGDFFDADEKRAYADSLCAWMNSKITQKSSAIAQPKQTASDLIEECRAALAEELAGWCIDPPLHHVKQAHDKCVAWMLTVSGMVYCTACEQNVSGPCNSLECSTPETIAQPEQPKDKP